MYPETGTTKADVLAYYAAVAPVPDPALPPTGRPPASAGSTASAPPTEPGEVFFQKNLDHSAPGWVPARRPSPTRAGPSSYPLVNDPATLTWLAQIAALEIHVPQWRVDSHGNALQRRTGWCWTWTPARAPAWPECVEVALLARAILQDVGLDPRAGHQRQQGHPPLRRRWTGPRARTRSPSSPTNWRGRWRLTTRTWRSAT